MVTDRILEEHHSPRPTRSLPIPRGVLVFAPHPDDEVYGCGGTLCLWAQQGVPVTVVVCTAGTQASPKGNPRLRLEESRCAASLLGYASPVFWNLQDREVRYGEGLVQRVRQCLETTQADWIFAPSVSERHPDHQVLGMAVAEAVRRARGGRTLAFYEVSAPLAANWLVDISTVVQAKEQAMRCFASQEALNPYCERVLGLNRYRGLNGDAACGWAEAFLVVKDADLQYGLRPVYGGYVDQRIQAGAALETSELPLVSVIIRSMDRPCVRDAIASVADGTYPNIELVLVNAKGGTHSPLPSLPPWWSVVLTDNQEPLARSRAANVGLAHAHGEYLIFLDDDDLLLPDHIARLVEELRKARKDVVAAYAGVTVLDEAGQVIWEYDQPWSFPRLLAANYIPNMALLFHRSLVEEKGCRFDESLEVLEDWDFFLQLAQHGDFLHVPGVSAVYRYGLGNSGLSAQRCEEYYRAHRARVITKWAEVLGIQILDESLYVLSQQMDQLRARWKAAQAEISAEEDLQKTLTDQVKTLTDQVEALKTEKAFLEETVASMRREIEARSEAEADLAYWLQETRRHAADVEQHKEAAEAQLREILNSRFWKITRPLRSLMRWGRCLFSTRLRNSPP